MHWKGVGMLFFKHRMKIERMFLKWCKDNGIMDVPNSVVAFMQIKGWLNEDKILEDLKKED